MLRNIDGTKFGNYKLRQKFVDVCASATTIGQYRAMVARLLVEYDSAVERAELAVKYKDASEAERELGFRKEMGDSCCCHVDPLILEHRAIQAGNMLYEAIKAVEEAKEDDV